MTAAFKMETADDTSETQSQTHTDLLWDHTGDVESDPLLGRESERQISPQRLDTLQLSYDQAQELLRVLDTTRSVLETFVGQVQAEGGRRTRRHGWWAYHCFPARRRTIAKYIFIITVVLQAVNLLAVSIIDVWPKRHDESVMDVSGVTMILLQLVNLFFIILVSVRLVNQLYGHKVSIWLLCQSYIATLMLFAGIYTLTYRMQRKSWKFIQEDLEQDPVLVIDLYSKFLYFSVSTATLCGSDNVLPKEWYNCIFTATQMLMSFCYFASILGQTLSQDTQYWLSNGPTNSDDNHTSSPSSPSPSSPYSPSSTSPSSSRVTATQRQSDVSSSLARLTGLSSSQAWRHYGSTNSPVSPTVDGGRGRGGRGRGVVETTRRSGDTAVVVVDGDGGDWGERGERGGSRSGSLESDRHHQRQHTVVVNIEPERSHSINSTSFPS